ncbi:hypothetical protein LTS10_009407 [Elasticomyces elasticus]|nr:hypothetical protein LTS10_009407 [Elasticomyces elasticus]
MTEHRGFYPDRRDNDVSPRIALASHLGTHEHCTVCRSDEKVCGRQQRPLRASMATRGRALAVRAEHRARGGSNASTSNGTTIYTPASDSPMTNKAKSRTTRASSAVLEAEGWLVRELVQDSPPTGTISGLVSPNQYVNFNQLHEIVSGNNTQIATKLQAFEIKPRNTTSRLLAVT